MRFASSLYFSLALLTSATGGVSLMSADAEACSYAIPDTIAVRPAADETGIPTNAQLWLTSAGVTEVKIEGSGGVIDTAVKQLKVHPFGAGAMYRVTPATSLAPSTRYTVTVKRNTTTESSFSFTTGTGPQAKVPDAPTGLKASARVTMGDSCYEGHPFAVRVTTNEVADTAVYELQISVDGGSTFAVEKYAATPQFEVTADALPSPIYRVRPLAITGVGADEPGLPKQGAPASTSGKDAEDPSNPDDSGGCVATRASGSSLLVLAAMGLMGGALRRRRDAR
jgi:hypothetical protein